MDKVYLILASGDVFEGVAIGAKGESVGEVVFTTGMTGYPETLTDPGYYGQIVVQTFPLIGNVGIIPEDIDAGAIGLKGYIVRQLCETPSNFRCKGTLGDFLKENGIVGIEGIDTRHLTKIIREKGVMNGIITSSRTLSEEQKKALASYSVGNAVDKVTNKEILRFAAQGDSRHSVALVNYGSYAAIKDDLVSRGCDVTVYPASVSADEVLKAGHDAVVLTGGPGDPSADKNRIKQAGILMASGKPVTGIGLGHQIMALSQGAAVKKLKYGHRGANQPAKDVDTGRIYVTTQSHGYVVEGDTLPADKGYVKYVNVNDGTCEGIRYAADGCFSVQFHPEGCAGPLDTQFLIDEIVANMEVR